MPDPTFCNQISNNHLHSENILPAECKLKSLLCEEYGKSRQANFKSDNHKTCGKAHYRAMFSKKINLKKPLDHTKVKLHVRFVFSLPSSHS